MDDVLKVIIFDLFCVHFLKVMVRVDCEKCALYKAVDLAMLKSSFDVLQNLWFVDNINVHQIISLFVVLLLERITLVNVLFLALNYLALLVFASNYLFTDRGDDSLLVKMRNTF